jgi:NADH:ubiquinone oxidoreductase subunit F (NADH-binding)
MVRAGPEGEFVNVGVTMGVLLAVSAGVLVNVGVEVGTTGVAEALVTPITADVAVKMDGVKVAGKKGVGAGWMTQPLQEDDRSTNKRRGMTRFIFYSSCGYCIPLASLGKVPNFSKSRIRFRARTLVRFCPAKLQIKVCVPQNL